MTIDQIVIYVGLFSAAYLLYSVVKTTANPQGAIPYKKFWYYGDDNIIFPLLFDVPAYKTSNSTSDNLKIFHFNNAEFQIDNAQFSDDFKYYQL